MNLLKVILATVFICGSVAAQNTRSAQVEKLSLLARTDIKAFAQQVSKGAPSELGKVAAIVHWLVHNFDWKDTDYRERTVQQIVERGGGNCNDFALVAIAAMKALDIHTRKVHDVHIRTESVERGEEPAHW